MRRTPGKRRRARSGSGHRLHVNGTGRSPAGRRHARAQPLAEALGLAGPAASLLQRPSSRIPWITKLRRADRRESMTVDGEAAPPPGGAARSFSTLSEVGVEPRPGLVAAREDAEIRVAALVSRTGPERRRRGVVRCVGPDGALRAPGPSVGRHRRPTSFGISEETRCVVAAEHRRPPAARSRPVRSAGT